MKIRDKFVAQKIISLESMTVTIIITTMVQY